MQPRIEVIYKKNIVGKRIMTTLAKNETGVLWGSFMPKKKEIKKQVGNDLYSIEIYASSLEFNAFNQDTIFEKWAGVEVTGFEGLPEGLESFIIPGGLYAVFLYKGASSAYLPTIEYIFRTWLPTSGYILDHRPHFELMGEKYKNNDPESEEEFWIPVKINP